MVKRIFLRGCQINGSPFVQSDEETVKKVQRLEKRRKCRVKNAECRVKNAECRVKNAECRVQSR